jgi:hypothetical protein
MSDNTITVTFDYNNDNPLWTIDPDSVPVRQGQQNIIWSLDHKSSPGAQFPATGGIVFKNDRKWPGTTPECRNEHTYTVTENNTNPGPGKIKYDYTINVLYTPADGQQRMFSKDPDVTNEPPTTM